MKTVLGKQLHPFAIIDCNRHQKSHRGFGAPYDGTEPKALTFFRHALLKRRDIVVEFICLSHPHADHYRGLADLIAGLMDLGIPIREFWDFVASAKKAHALSIAAIGPEQKDETAELVRLCEILQTLRESGCKYRFAQPDTEAWRGHGTVVEIIAPDPDLALQYYNYAMLRTDKDRRDFAKAYPDAANENTISSALLVSYGNLKAILGGDLTNSGWEAILPGLAARRLSPHILKLSHHGSSQGNFPHGRPLPDVLLGRPGGLVALISGGYLRALPHVRTLESLDKSACRYYCTGPISKGDLEPYLPSNAPLDIAHHLHGQFFTIEEFEGLGHGNITVQGNRDGGCTVSTEAPSCLWDIFRHPIKSWDWWRRRTRET